MTERGFTLFDTALGRCAIAWGRWGVIGLQLPEQRESATRARIEARFPDAREAAPPREVQRAIEAVARLLCGEGADLSAITLDMDGIPPFHRLVYQAARGIAPGVTRSYGELAALAGAPRSARAVGQAMRRNPFPIVVPCHRVVAAGGKVGGFTASGGTATKVRMLALEAPRRPAPADVAAGLGFDPPVAIAHVREADEPLGRLIDAVGPFALEVRDGHDLFGALAQSIVYQQLNGRAARTIFERVCALFPDGAAGLTGERLLATAPERLRAAGLSQNKLLSLQDLARRDMAGSLPSMAEVRTLSDDEIVKRLTEVRGIGRWTVEMLLIFRLGRPDVLPLDDYGIRKGFALAFKKRALPERAALERRGRRWRPYRTLVSWYLWRAVDLEATASRKYSSEVGATAKG